MNLIDYLKLQITAQINRLNLFQRLEAIEVNQAELANELVSLASAVNIIKDANAAKLADISANAQVSDELVARLGELKQAVENSGI